MKKNLIKSVFSLGVGAIAFAASLSVSSLMASDVSKMDVKKYNGDVDPIEIQKDYHMKGVSFSDFSIIVFENSEFEKDLLDVLIKHKKIVLKDKVTTSNIKETPVSLSEVTKINLNACKSCHGQNLEKEALGKSLKVSDMSEDEIFKALKGYKEDTYGRDLKALMKGQLKNYTESDLKQISKQIKE